MHGVVLYELSRFGQERLGMEAWRAVLRAAQLEGEVFSPLRPMPDDRVVVVVAALARALGVSAGEVQRDFGRFIAPHLVATYSPLIPPGWGAPEILANVEEVIHRAIRLRDETASPPRLVSRRLDDGSIAIDYDSPRRLCDFAIGLVEGISLAHGRIAQVEQRACMHRGAPRCEINVTFVA